MDEDDSPGDDLRINRRLSVPRAALSERFVHSSGPGGQNVNKLSTKVELRLELALWPLEPEESARLVERLGKRVTRDGAVVIHADTERTREGNRALARSRLAALLAAALTRPRVRRPTRPTRGSQERRVKAKKKAGERKAERRSRGDA